MATEYVYRVLLLYPESLRAGVEAWYASEWPDAGELLTPCGTKDGEKWYVSSFVARRSDLERWIGRFENSVGQSVPAGLLDMPRDAQRAVMAQLAIAALATVGVAFSVVFNDQGESIDHLAVMAAHGIDPLPHEVE